MTEPEKNRTFSLGLMLALSMVAVFVTVYMRMNIGAEEPAPWNVVGVGILLAGSAFLVMYWLQSGFWGMAAAVLITLHPARSVWNVASVQFLDANALGLALLAVAVAGLELACRRQFSGLAWVKVVAAGTTFLITAWAGWPETAQSASLLMLVAFPLSFLSSLYLFRRGGVGRPSPGNTVCSLFAGFLIHFSALACICRFDGTYLDLSLSQVASLGNSSAWQLRVFETASLEKWCWPNPWTVVPLVIWGLLRTVWRGWKDFNKGRPGASWLLGIYAVIMLFSLLTEVDRDERLIVSALATVAVLLVVFGVADVFHGIGDRLILAPPEN